jgi:protein-S-isoprenylcysteine O-methyltransferase Ste14
MSNILIGTICLIAASLVWGLVHSVLASYRVKDAFRRFVGPLAFDRFYRFAYNVFALISFLPILALLYIFPDQPLYTIPVPWVYLTIAIQAVAVIVLIAAVAQTGPLEFMGLAQLTAGSERKPPILMTNGFYAYVRHPLYTGILVFIWLIPEMTVNRLVFFAALSIYLLIGAYFEERKLLKDFDPAYAAYKSKTPMFIPKIL